MSIVAVVIPAYNEAATLRDVVERALKLMTTVIVVDDGSTDATASVVQDLPIVLLRNDGNHGKAASLWRGMQHALQMGAHAVITLDGDGQHNPEDIPRLLEASRTRPRHLIIGARLGDPPSKPEAPPQAPLASCWCEAVPPARPPPLQRAGSCHDKS